MPFVFSSYLGLRVLGHACWTSGTHQRSTVENVSDVVPHGTGTRNLPSSRCCQFSGPFGRGRPNSAECSTANGSENIPDGPNWLYPEPVPSIAGAVVGTVGVAPSKVGLSPSLAWVSRSTNGVAPGMSHGSILLSPHLSVQRLSMATPGRGCVPPAPPCRSCCTTWGCCVRSAVCRCSAPPSSRSGMQSLHETFPRCQLVWPPWPPW